MQRAIDHWDPGAARQFVDVLAPIAKLWFRAEVRGLDALRTNGGALVVCNHSGGMLTPDVLIFAAAFYRELGYDRPLYTLAHDALFVGPLSDWLTRIGVIPASHAAAADALRQGGVVLDFPGGVHDAYRPTLSENVVDFNGRTGYVRVAAESNVPIVPAVSIGGQESQLFLTRVRGSRNDWVSTAFVPTSCRSLSGSHSASAWSCRRTCLCRPRSSPRCWNR
jgi:1-acyl-sn-glycerol-3-phosphate acyltransferase